MQTTTLIKVTSHITHMITTFHFMSKKFTVMHGDKRVAEERAEEIEEGNDAVGVLKRHGRPPGDQLKQRHHRAEGADTES